MCCLCWGENQKSWKNSENVFYVNFFKWFCFGGILFMWFLLNSSPSHTKNTSSNHKSHIFHQTTIQMPWMIWEKINFICFIAAFLHFTLLSINRKLTSSWLLTLLLPLCIIDQLDKKIPLIWFYCTFLILSLLFHHFYI